MDALAPYLPPITPQTKKFKKASQGIYDIFSKAEKHVVLNMPVMMFTVYGCILLISWLGAKQIVQDTDKSPPTAH